jgi:hypothetical protein
MAAALLVAGIMAFLLVFFIAMTIGTDSLYGGAAGWAIIIALAVVAHRTVAAHIASGRYDLVIDPAAGLVTVPAMFKRKEPIVVRIDDVTALDVTVVANKGEGALSERDENGPRHSPVLVWREAAGVQSAKLGDFALKNQAESLAAWVRERLGVTSPTSSTADSRHATVA